MNNNSEGWKMKIYEIRDISSDEQYFSKGFFATLDEAKKHVDEDTDLEGICDFEDEFRIAGVFEHELGKWDHEEGFNKKVYDRSVDVFKIKYPGDAS